MGAVDLLGVEPQVPLLRRPGGQAVVLPVAAAHKNRQSGGGTELPGLAGALEGLLFPTLGAKIAAVGQFGADIVEILLGLSLRQLLQNTLQVLQFSTGSGQLLCEVFFRGLGFVYFLKYLAAFSWGERRTSNGISMSLHAGS